MCLSYRRDRIAIWTGWHAFHPLSRRASLSTSPPTDDFIIKGQKRFHFLLLSLSLLSTRRMTFSINNRFPTLHSLKEKVFFGKQSRRLHSQFHWALFLRVEFCFDLHRICCCWLGLGCHPLRLVCDERLPFSLLKLLHAVRFAIEISRPLLASASITFELFEWPDIKISEARKERQADVTCCWIIQQRFTFAYSRGRGRSQHSSK